MTFVVCVTRFEELASAGDFGDFVEGDVGWWRRAAKSLLESDRMKQLGEIGGYTARLCKMVPLEASPKNDIIIAWREAVGGEGGEVGKVFGKVDERGFNIPEAYTERCWKRGEDAKEAYLGDFEADEDAAEVCSEPRNRMCSGILQDSPIQSGV